MRRRQPGLQREHHLHGHPVEIRHHQHCRRALQQRLDLLTVPSSVSVAANATSATFTASTGALVSDQAATITATLNGSSAAATLSLVAPAAPVTLSALEVRRR